MTQAELRKRAHTALCNELSNSPKLAYCWQDKPMPMAVRMEITVDAMLAFAESLRREAISEFHPVLWTVKLRGKYTGNNHQSEQQAIDEMRRLDKEYPDGKREVAALCERLSAVPQAKP